MIRNFFYRICWPIYGFLSFFTFTISVSAQAGTSPDNKVAVISNPLGATSTIPAFIGKLLDIVFNIGSLLAVFFIIYSGFLMVTAGSNEEKLSKARQAFLWTVIGVAILLGAKVLSAVICGTINQLGTGGITCLVS